jgi:hypothetical protein
MTTKTIKRLKKIRGHQLQLHFLAGFSHSLNYQYHMHSVKGFVMVHIKNIKKSNAFGQDYLLLFISRALTRTSPLPCTKAEKFEDSVFARLLLEANKKQSLYLFPAKYPPLFAKFCTNIFRHVLSRYPSIKASKNSDKTDEFLPDTMRRVGKAY